MSAYTEFETLGKKQATIQQGIDSLKEIQKELNSAAASADSWAMLAIIANASLIPLNAIINALELKQANTAYQATVRFLYDKFAKSGTRIDNEENQIPKELLSGLKTVLTKELTRKAMTDLVPAVNVIVGLAEDSIALMEVVKEYSSGREDTKQIARTLSTKIDTAYRELFRLGTRRLEILNYMKKVQHTA